MSADTPDPDFSDSDLAWFQRLSGAEPSRPPASDAEREADLLRAAFARGQARRAAALAAEPPPASPADEAAAAEAQHQRWLKVQARFQQNEAARRAQQVAAEPPLQAQPAADEPRQPLRPTGAQPVPPRWRWDLRWAGGGALAASLLAVLVLTQRPDGVERIYDDVPEERQRGDTTVQRLPVAQPRQAAEALHAALRQAGEPAALYQHGKVFIVLLQVSSETTPAARAAMAAAGVQVQPGPLRIEFQPR